MGSVLDSSKDIRKEQESPPRKAYCHQKALETDQDQGMKMAKKKEPETKIVMERAYNVPLRKGFQKAPKYRRAKKAINTLRGFLIKNMKSDNVKIGKYLNLELWKNGIKNPPHHVKVKVTKDSEGLVKAELVGAPAEKAPAVKKKPEKKEEKEEKKKEKPESIEKALDDLEKKAEKIKEEKQEKAKETEAEEIKELKKNPPEAPREAKQQPKETKQPEEPAKHPRGGQKLEPHHGSKQ